MGCVDRGWLATRLVIVTCVAAALVGPTAGRARAGQPADARTQGLAEVRDLLEDAQTQQGALADAAAEAEQQLAEAEAALHTAQISRAAADEEHREALGRQEAAEQRAEAAGAELRRVGRQLDAALREYELEDARLRARARETYMRSTGGVAEGEAALEAILDERELDVALNRMQLLRKIASRQADTAAGLQDLADRIRGIHEARAEQTARAEAAVADAVEATNAAEDARAKLEVLAQREAATYEATQDLVDALAVQQEDQAATVEALTDAVAHLEAEASALHVTSTTRTVPAELARYGNGRVPADALVRIGRGSHRLWKPAAEAFTAMAAAAEEDGVHIGVTDSYRDYAAQVDVARRKGLYAAGGLAARPGTSNHGWGLALDLDLDADALAWMRANADRFGYVEDTPREPWHWGFHARP